ncbi:MAG: hypothetical protein LBQ54_05655 [Planctomycetaceae bacterium]|nr:hypothetical protein [Planctomycetaceae bacterium]
MFCTNCGNEVHEKAVVCVRCGCSLGKQNRSTGVRETDSEIKQSWNAGLFILFIFLTLLCPLVGWILGGISLSKAKCSEGRRQQGMTLVILGFVSAFINGVLNVCLMIAANSY